MPKRVIFFLKFILLYCNFLHLSNVPKVFPHPIPFLVSLCVCVRLFVFDKKTSVT